MASLHSVKSGNIALKQVDTKESGLSIARNKIHSYENRSILTSNHIPILGEQMIQDSWIELEEVLNIAYDICMRPHTNKFHSILCMTTHFKYKENTNLIKYHFLSFVNLILSFEFLYINILK